MYDIVCIESPLSKDILAKYSAASYSYQPAPFFVLDEIDAALDNTNINRVSCHAISIQQYRTSSVLNISCPRLLGTSWRRLQVTSSVL